MPGPVLSPPCIRHLTEPRTAGAWHGSPPRVRARAPQRGAEFGSPERLPFFSRPELAEIRGAIPARPAHPGECISTFRHT